MKLLIYDLETTGHHTEYIKHIISYVTSCQSIKLVVVTNYDLINKAPKLVDNASSNIEFDFISKELYDHIFDSNLSLKRSVREYKLLKKKISKHQPDKTILLHLNVFQFSLNFFSRIRKTKIRGILFHPFFRSSITGIGDKLNYIRKWLQLKWLLSSTIIERIWLLNDPKGAMKLGEIYGDYRFYNLNDPILPHQSNIPSNIYDQYCIPKNSKVFLFLGHISERKGVFQAIEAFKKSFVNQKNEAFLLICGKCESVIKNKLYNDIRNLKDNGFMCQYDNRFISDDEMTALFQQAEVILMPYLMSVGSSGILGHAAQARKLVIGPNFGLLGEIIKEYNLGIGVDTGNVDELAEALTKCLNMPELSEHETSGMIQYVEERKPIVFVEEMLNEND